MSTASKVDPSTLGWVKTEIDETLKQARLALESFAENPADEAQLRFCATYLHQVLGTLQMVELDGAALLAREVEALAQAALNKKVAADASTFELLIRAILSLPDYLARLQFGQPDVPLRALPIINEMRALRQVEALSDLEFFAPDLSVRAPAGGPPGSTADFGASLKKLRPAYQAALLTWLKDTGNRPELDKMLDILDRLQHEAPLPAAAQLFWVAGGFVHALAAGDLEVSNDRKKLLGRIEQQMKRLGQGSDDGAQREACESLTKSLLLQVAEAKPNDGRVVELKQAFDLDLLLGKAHVEGADMQDLPTPEALVSVSQALGKEIENAQDLLSAYFDSTREDVKTLDPLVALLLKMSGTLEMLGVQPMKALVDALIDAAQGIMDGQIEVSEAASMQMAGGLLLIENSAREIYNSGSAWKRQVDERIAGLAGLRTGDTSASLDGIEISDAALSETEFKQLLKVVSAEIRVNLNKVEEALETFAADPGDLRVIEVVPQYLNQIQGALEILGQERTAELAVITRRYIEDIQRGMLVPDHAVFDALAIAVGTVEVYLEGLERDRPNLESLIASALAELEETVGSRVGGTIDGRALAPIEQNLQAWLDDRQNGEALASLHADLEALVPLARQQQRDKIATLADEMVKLVELVRDDPAQVTDEIVETLKTSGEILVALGREARPGAAEPVTAEPAAPRAAAAADAVEDLDEEIMQIFIEDAKEVFQTIERSLVAWHAEPYNREALLELRRGYHTLKGSGRMVGAAEVAELAWSVENMLNQIREGKLSHSQAIFDLLYEVKAVLPGLIAQLEGGPAPDADIAALRSRAGQLASSARESEDEVPATSPGQAAAAERAQRPERAPVLDPTLLQIFTAEASGHLTTIRAFAAAGGGPVTHNLMRAVHTLQGNARSLKLGGMAQACAELEKYLHVLQVRQLLLEDRALALLTQVHTQVEELLVSLNAGGGLTPDAAERFSSLARAFAREHQRLDTDEPAAAENRPAPAVRFAPAPGPRTPPPDVAPIEDAADEQPEQIDPELMEIFREEAVDILEQIEEALTRWRSNRADTGAVHSLKRSLHTLKGGARMAGAMTMGNVAHNTESLLKQAEEGRIGASNDLLDVLDEVHDQLVVMLEQVAHHRAGATPGVRALNAKVLALLEGGAAPAYVEARAEAAAPVSGPPGDEAMPGRDVREPMPTAPDAPSPVLPAHAANGNRHAARGVDTEEEETDAVSEGKARREHIKVRTGLLNELVNHAGEVSIARARMEQQIFGLREHLAELNRNVTRFREQIRELEIQSESQILYRAGEEIATSHPDFDPLEFDRFSKLQHLSRGLAESLHDLAVIQSTLGNFVGEAETALQQQARVNTELQEGLMRTRMINFSTQAARLRHIVRQTSREVGKRAELQIIGTEVEVDRNVLERMIGPFEHMIRNAIDHGIESDQERKRLKKPAAGTITIQTAHEGSEIVIRFSDDGAGLNVDAIRKKAVERGLMKPGADLSDEEVMQFILLPGFSTAQKITHLSGRGVGMDVVHNEVKQLGGTITVETRPGAGTTFTVRLPLTLSITQALMVYAGDQLFAIPLGSVVNILDVPIDKVNHLSMGERPLFNYEEQVYPFMHLGARLGLPPAHSDSRKVPVLVAKSGTRHIALRIDGLAGTREVVIKSLGPQLSELKGLAGATILGDGRVVLILDISGLWLTDDTMRVAGTREPDPAETPRRRPVVMVVDDSLTVRKVTSRHLQKRGIDVLVAKDGLDAWEQLRGERVPDVMLVDIEMPRMDGYELTTNVRSDPNLKHIPIIMITSRAGTKHRDRALALGVNTYMSKPYQEDELMRNIESMLPAALLQ